MGHEQPTSSAVRISIGQVDLETPNYSSPDSKAAVSMEDTRAQLGSNSSAAVKNDPTNKENEIVVSSGTAEVQRGQEKVEIGAYQKASFATGGTITKSDVLAPPGLVRRETSSRSSSKIQKRRPSSSSGSPCRRAVSYTLQISTTAMFTRTGKEADQELPERAWKSLGWTGDYFWNVTATDAKERNQRSRRDFQVYARGAGQVAVDATGN